ncbi:GNAT family N-acetyltransferase [Ideonella sp. 4Y16]|uniref:GNAT family N-acetyltransferase n=1 Tax=Ideonella alba TaxID=2824118 RepID=A0A940YAA2_9BURK|nr:GNAT family N-acetyltransferase [Ideonella alba]MBQ0929052.1 GNAT family N-acetyltransferase [Ideonella alba]MBQ0942995.1 GNAT family N-acetyltransferase [Ideonella alba]
MAEPIRYQTAPAGFTEWGALLTLLQDAFAYMDGRIDPPSSLKALDAAALQAKAGRETLIVAHEGDTLVGCGFVDLRPDCAYLGKLAVADAWRRRGVARGIVEAAAALARAAGRPVLELQTRVELVENHRSFEALGFVTVARTAHPGFDRPTSLTMRRPL